MCERLLRSILSLRWCIDCLEQRRERDGFVLGFGFEGLGIISSFAEASEDRSDFGFSASNFQEGLSERGAGALDQPVIFLARAFEVEHARGQVAVAPRGSHELVIFEHGRTELVIVRITAFEKN